MTPPMTAANEMLREYVTSSAFVLSLGKTHIAALVWLDVCIRSRQYVRADGRPWSHFASGIRGCIERGLVIHHFNPQARIRGVDHLGRHYTITKAGRLTRELLKEAGIWQEYEAALPRLAAVS